MSDNTAPSDEGLDELIRDLLAEPISLGEREAWQSYTFAPNAFNRENSQSGRWRRGTSTEVATVRLFGWVHDNSMLGPYGSMERSHLQWFNPTNMAKSQKQLLVLYLPPEIDPRSITSRFMNIQARNLYYILRAKADLPDLDWVMEDETRERSPQNRTHWWITTTEGGTFITLTSKLWQDKDANPTKTGGSLPRNLYTPRARPGATSANPSASSSINNHTMATWPNPRNYDYSRDPEARNYRLAPLDALDENDDPIARVDFQNALRPGTAVVVDVTMTLWRIKDNPKDRNNKDAPASWTDTFQLIMQQIKVVKPAPDPYAGAVYMEDLGPEFQPPPTPASNKRRAATPALELSPPTKKPLPATPSKVQALAARTRSPSWPPFSSVVGPSNPPARSVASSSMATPTAPPPPSTQPDLSQGDEYLLIYDSDNQADAAMEDVTDSTRKPKTKTKGKGKGRAK